MAKSTEDATLDFTMGLLRLLEKKLEEYCKMHKLNRQFKSMTKSLRKITDNGKKAPIAVTLDSKDIKYKRELDRKIANYNRMHKKNRDRKKRIHVIPLLTKEGWTYLTNQEGVDKIKEFERQILKEQNIRKPEITMHSFKQEFDNKEGVVISNLSGNEMNLIKRKPWSNHTYEDAFKGFSSTFATIPKKDGNYEAVFNKKNGKKSVTKDIFKDVALAKIILSGDDGKTLEKKMDYERDILSLFKNPRNLPDGINEVYITSATDVNDYVVLNKEGYSFHHTSAKDGNFVDVVSKTVSFEEGMENDYEYVFECISDMKSIENPCILSDKTTCLKHCIAGNICEKGIDLEGKEIDLPLLKSEQVFKNREKVDVATDIIEIAKASLLIEGVEDPNMDDLLNRSKEVAITVSEISEGKKLFKDVVSENPAFSVMEKRKESLLDLSVPATDIKQLFDVVELKSKNIVISEKSISNVMENVSVDYDKLKNNTVFIKKEMDKFSLSTLKEVTLDKNIEEDFEFTENLDNNSGGMDSYNYLSGNEKVSSNNFSGSTKDEEFEEDDFEMDEDLERTLL